MPDGTQEFKYVDAFEMGLDPWQGAWLTFGMRAPAGEGRSNLQEHAHLIMPARHFKAMIFIMAKQLKTYEQQCGETITIPAELFATALKSSSEEWHKFWGETQWGGGQLDGLAPPSSVPTQARAPEASPVNDTYPMQVSDQKAG
jgi:hypothetical protein